MANDVRPAQRIRVPILTYHALDQRPSAITVSPETFQWQMEELHRGGFQVISLSRLVISINTGASLPDRPVVIAFDDGFESVYTHALPVLQWFGFPATVFLVPGYCGKLNDWPSQPAGAPRLPLMDWPQIRELGSHGFEFGGHTSTHPRLDQVPPETLEGEILESKRDIEERLGETVETFAYPYGRSDDASEALVRRGYAGACTTRLAMAGPKSDPLSLERVDAYYLQHPLMFRRLANPAFPLYLGLRRLGRTVASTVLKREWQ